VFPRVSQVGVQRGKPRVLDRVRRLQTTQNDSNYYYYNGGDDDKLDGRRAQDLRRVRRPPGAARGALILCVVSD